VAPRKHEALRTCLGCRHPQGRDGLIRIVRGPEGEAVFDPDGRLPGRGSYVCPTPACVGALTAGALGKVLRGPVKLADPQERRAALAAVLERRAANLLSIARKARGTAFGEHAVRAAITSGRAQLLLLGSELSDRDVTPWQRLAGDLPVRAPATAEVIGRWAGRGPTKVAAVCEPGLAETITRVLDQWGAISAPSVR
jgi:predicted RNA-binding protein YlxR (DUF448 family)